MEKNTDQKKRHIVKRDTFIYLEIYKMNECKACNESYGRLVIELMGKEKTLNIT